MVDKIQTPTSKVSSRQERIEYLVQMLNYHNNTFARIPLSNLSDVGKTAALLISSILGYKKVAIVYTNNSGQPELLAAKGDIVAEDMSGNTQNFFTEYLWSQIDSPQYLDFTTLDQQVSDAATMMGMKDILLAVPVIGVSGPSEERTGMIIATQPGDDFDADADLTILEIITGLISGAIANCLSHQSLKSANRKLRERENDLKKSLLSLEDANQRMLAILEGIEAFVYVVDVESYEILYLNKFCKELYGDVVGSTCWQVLQKGMSGPCDFCPNKKLVHDENLAGKTYIWEQFNTFNGRWYSAQDRLMRWVDGSLVKIQIAIDTTEQKQAEKEKEKVESQLHQAQKMESIGRLAGGVAHDFNNILSVINGYAELCLLKMEDSQPLRKEIEIILKSGERAARLTQQLLAFSRKQIIRQELLELNKIVDESHKMLARLLGEDIDIEINHGKGPFLIKADRSQLEQVVLNFAVNARDAMPSGGKLTIETANVSFDETYMKSHYNITPGDYVMLAISDNGHGMDEETKKHIFEPFFTTKEQGKGTGLGLATIYGIIKQNNGQIQVYSELGKGTTFKIYLPSADESIEKIKEVSSAKDIRANLGTETILLVEDDEMVRKLSVDTLSTLGYTILEAENGEDALQVCSRFHGKVDLLLTDVVMPKMNGVELAEKITELYPKAKVLFMSGYTENAIVRHGILADDVNFIHKPVTPTSLSQAVRKVLA